MLNPHTTFFLIKCLLIHVDHCLYSKQSFQSANPWHSIKYAWEKCVHYHRWPHFRGVCKVGFHCRHWTEVAIVTKGVQNNDRFVIHAKQHTKSHQQLGDWPGIHTGNLLGATSIIECRLWVELRINSTLDDCSGSLLRRTSQHCVYV